jgi:hypothetical protein
MRGILGVEYVMFMEDGLPVFPTMHTFFHAGSWSRCVMITDARRRP